MSYYLPKMGASTCYVSPLGLSRYLAMSPLIFLSAQSLTQFFVASAQSVVKV